MTSVLITTGATVTFTSLIKTVLTIDFINNLIKSGVTKLIIQYGNEIKNLKHISAQYFQTQLQSSNIVKYFKFDVSDDLNRIIMQNNSFKIVAFAYDANIVNVIHESDVVISHAGTGSIIDTLRSNKKLIVVPNDKLMDNHQLEIANEFTKLNYCLCYNVDELTLTQFFEDLRKLLIDEIKLKTFPEVDGSIIETIITEELEK